MLRAPDGTGRGRRRAKKTPEGTRTPNLSFTRCPKTSALSIRPRAQNSCRKLHLRGILALPVFTKHAPGLAVPMCVCCSSNHPDRTSGCGIEVDSLWVHKWGNNSPFLVPNASEGTRKARPWLGRANVRVLQLESSRSNERLRDRGRLFSRCRNGATRCFGPL